MKQASDTAGATALAPVQLIKVADIVPDPKNQKRPDGVEVLAASIKRDGLLQPIILRPNSDAKAKVPYMLVAGERRWEAHKLLKLDVIEARVRPASLTDSNLDAARKRHAENFHREDLSPIQKARALQELFDLKMPQAEIAAFVGAKDQSTVSNFCRLLRLPAKVQDMVHRGELTAAHAKALLRWERWPKVCEKIAELSLKEEATSKQLEDEDLPYAWHLVKAGLVAEFSTAAYSSDHFEVTAEMKKDPDYLIGSYNSYCFSPEKWKAEQARQLPLIAERKKKQAAAAHRSAGAAKMSEAEKKARAKKIADNKRNRTETAAQLEVAFDNIRGLKALDHRALVLVLSKVLRNGHYSSALKDAAKKLGVVPPKGLVVNSWYSSVSTKVLSAMSDVDALKLTVAAVVLHHGEEAVKYSNPVPEELQLIAGKAKKGSK